MQLQLQYIVFQMDLSNVVWDFFRSAKSRMQYFMMEFLLFHTKIQQMMNLIENFTGIRSLLELIGVC